MDGQQQETLQPKQQHPLSFLQGIEWTVRGVAIGLSFFLLVFVILNYFNILPLSQLYPNQLGFLPHRPYAEQNVNLNPAYPTSPKLTLYCPVAKEFCKSGKSIYDGNTFLGIGFKLPPKTKVFAAMPGSAFFTATEDKTRGITTHTKVVVGGKNVTQGYAATYEYFAPSASGSATTKDIIQGEELGELGFGQFPNKPPYDNINFLFSVQKEGKSFELKASDFTLSDFTLSP